MSVYSLADPRDGRVRYVGQSGNPRFRLMTHLCPSSQKTRVGKWVAELRAAGMTPELRVFGRRRGSEAKVIRELAPDLNIKAGETRRERPGDCVRNLNLQIRLTFEEKALLEAQANRERLPLATWIRQLALKAAATPEERPGE